MNPLNFKEKWSIKNILPVMVLELSIPGIKINRCDRAIMTRWGLINDELPIDELEKTKTPFGA